ncbi:MAG TPA: nuclear transport factor 2 family protein [Jiangellaceae bacterium]|nr:nuclear transport factor 2 family protein [Jiangellaceae bacterium]
MALYAADALMSTEPFREPYRGRDGVRSYVSKAFNEEEDPQAQFGTPIVDGDRAAVSWWASLREEGADTTSSRWPGWSGWSGIFSTALTCVR